VGQDAGAVRRPLLLETGRAVQVVADAALQAHVLDRFVHGFLEGLPDPAAWTSIVKWESSGIPHKRFLKWAGSLRAAEDRLTAALK
jgi:hypothetical protein